MAGNLFGSVEAWGLDGAAAAAFLGLLWPRLKNNLALAGIGALVALVAIPLTPAGVPVLLAAVVALLPIGGKK